MRSSHIFLGGVAAATFGVLLVTPVAAQDEMPPAQDIPAETPIDQMQPDAPVPPAAELSPEQQAEYDVWAPDQKFAYDAWPPETQMYYWTLSSDEQSLFWRLSDQDKISLTAMTGPEREAAWEVIKSNAAEAEGPA